MTAKREPIVYAVTLPDGSTATRRSPTRRVYTHAVARKIGDGPWEAVSFARTRELAEREERTQRTLQERWQRKHRNESHPEFTFTVIPCSVAGGGQ